MKLKPIVFAVAISISCWALGATKQHQSQDLDQFLKQFNANPKEVMQQLPYKENSKGNKFGDQINENNFVQIKSKSKKNFCRNINGVRQCLNNLSIQGRASFRSNDLAQNLVDSGYNHLESLDEIESHPNKLSQGRLSTQPWSDDYWAIAQGILGKRYADPNKWWAGNWKHREDYVVENPAKNYIETGFVQYLSPSEKYDLLVGDENFTLTSKMWEEGRRFYKQHGFVENWMGICHGWAVAAYMLDRPTGMVNVMAYDGKTVIPFYPSDIKGLSSLLWAKASPDSRFVGGRCNDKNVATDENGRALKQDCIDTNAGTWHKVVINQIGISDRSFVMDATFDYEVWNQPVISYHYKYFNPETLEIAYSWEDARIRTTQFSKDKFKSYRNSNPYYVVGVEMTVQYMAENSPSTRKHDNENYDGVTTVKYRYDLELNKNGKILGGEWYSKAHPDFLWTPAKNAKAGTSVDEYVNGKLSENGVPKNWKRWATNYNGQGYGLSDHGIPIAKVVEGLIRLSRQ